MIDRRAGGQADGSGQKRADKADKSGKKKADRSGLTAVWG